MLTLAFNIQPVKASGTIYVRADGSIDPPDAPILTVDNITYTFAGNINDSIVVERDNIVLMGQATQCDEMASLRLPIQSRGFLCGLLFGAKTKISLPK